MQEKRIIWMMLYIKNASLLLRGSLGECYVDHAGATLYSDTQIRNVGADLHGSLYANPHSIGSSLTQDIIERTRYRLESQINEWLYDNEFTINLNNYSQSFEPFQHQSWWVQRHLHLGCHSESKDNRGRISFYNEWKQDSNVPAFGKFCLRTGQSHFGSRNAGCSRG